MSILPATNRTMTGASSAADFGAAATECSADVASRMTFDEIYDESIDFVWRGVRRLGVPEAFAEDVVQQVYLVVHRRINDFEGRSSIKTWVFSILLHVVRDFRRTTRRKLRHTSSTDEPIDPDTLPTRVPTPHDALTRSRGLAVLDHCLKDLDEERRTVFVLAELEQMTPAEIAEITATPVHVVYGQLRAARADFERIVTRFRQREERTTR